MNTKPWTHTPELTDADKLRISKTAANGKSLIKFLASGKATIDEIKRIILYEITERAWKREYILNRCWSRLGKLQRSKAEKALNELYYENGGI